MTYHPDVLAGGGELCRAIDNGDDDMVCLAIWQAMLAAAPAAPSLDAGAPNTLKIHGLSLEVAKNLVGLFGGDETDMTVEFIVDGHSGTGFYAWCTEYPEDGSDYLGPVSEYSYLTALASPEKGGA